MLAEDAFTTLGLNPGATADEIRQAYRDLVKVWHPDRFGTDVRLRVKAEDHLKQINEAYRTLEAADFRPKVSAAEPVTTATEPAADTSAAARPGRPGISPERTVRLGLYAVSAVLLAAMGMFVAHQVAAVPHSKAPAVAPAASAAASEPQKAARVRHSGGAAPHTGTGDFQVWSFSQADSDRMQMACAAHPAGSESYRTCIAAQAHALQRSPGPPQMTAMSTAEREAAESACATSRSGSDDAAYNRCLKRQVAAVAAEPIRPDLSSFNAADRHSVQSACAASRKQGAAEFDRCLVRFARTLQGAEAQTQ